MVYGARLESVLGASPHEFKSRILRHQPERKACWVQALTSSNLVSSAISRKAWNAKPSGFLFRAYRRAARRNGRSCQCSRSTQYPPNTTSHTTPAIAEPRVEESKNSVT